VILVDKSLYYKWGYIWLKGNKVKVAFCRMSQLGIIMKTKGEIVIQKLMIACLISFRKWEETNTNRSV